MPRHNAMIACSRNGSEAESMLNVGPRWSWMVCFTLLVSVIWLFSSPPHFLNWICYMASNGMDLRLIEVSGRHWSLNTSDIIKYLRHHSRIPSAGTKRIVKSMRLQTEFQNRVLLSTVYSYIHLTTSFILVVLATGKEPRWPRIIDDGGIPVQRWTKWW
jgi:hypothetical protein